MTEISNIKEVYATGIPQKVREIFDYYSKLDLSDAKNQKKVEVFKDDIYLFREKLIVLGLQKYKVYGDCGKNAYGVRIFINPKNLKDLTIILSKTENGYQFCKVNTIDLLYSQRKSFNLYLKKFDKKYWI